MSKFTDKVNRFFRGRYGVDELGKLIMIVCTVVYLIGLLLKSSSITVFAMLGYIYCFYRILSKKHWERSEENRKYMRVVKLWKLRFQERKTSRIYMCKSCGKYIRVPKGKGKIEVRCRNCGCRSIRRT